MFRLSSRTSVLLHLLPLLNLATAIATTHMPLIALTLPQNITSTLRNFTTSLTYATLTPPNITSTTPDNTSITTKTTFLSQSTALPINYTSSPLQITTPPAMLLNSSLSASSSPALQTTTTTLPPPPSIKSCQETCPGTGKVCGSRMKGDCKADTLYSCFNNWDPPLQGEDKDCSFVDGKKGVCKQVQQGFWDRFKGSFKDGCVAG
jgi:hypothetical protein